VTLPGPDAQSSRVTPRRPQIIIPNHSIPTQPPIAPYAAQPAVSSSPASEPLVTVDHEHALDFATHSWDLATGGLKTLTAKRELPMRPERRSSGVVPDILATSRSYMFALVIMVCIVLMLLGGGIVLLVMLQP
jgi:hypothetical protein